MTVCYFIICHFVASAKKCPLVVGFMHDLIVNQSIKFDPSTANFAQCCQKTKNKFVFVYTFTQKDDGAKKKELRGWASKLILIG